LRGLLLKKWRRREEEWEIRAREWRRKEGRSREVRGGEEDF